MRYISSQGVVSKDKNKMLLIGLALAYILTLSMSVIIGVDARRGERGPAPKVDVCHFVGNGSYRVINISENALQSHVDEHGDYPAGVAGDPVEVLGEGWFYTDEECGVEFIRSAMISSPEDVTYTIGDPVQLSAYLVDKDSDDDVAWAVRDDCSFSGTNYAGNVGGLSDVASWDGATFEFTFDTTGVPEGDYCFIFNPTESASDELIRETQEFSLAFYERSAEIASPLPQTYTVGDQIDLLATLDDKNGDDSVAWAVRSTCTTGTNFAGNVGGFSTDFGWDYENFSAVFDTTGLSAGDYCFIFNPTETTGVDTPIREVAPFSLRANVAGEWLLSVNTGSYLHDMIIVQDVDGNLTGEGGYPAGSGPSYPYPYNWTVTGEVDGVNVAMTIVYQNGYTAEITGTFDGTSTMSGGAGTGGVANWTATRI